MEANQINEIITWIRAHPNHVYESAGETFEGDTPAEVWFRFCRNPSLVNEYEDLDIYTTDASQVVNGCTYIFSSDSCVSGRCNVVPVPGKNRCSFHDHLIFSAEVRDYLRNRHADINKDFSVFSQGPVKKDTEVTTQPATTKQMAIVFISDNLYYETENKLAIHTCGGMVMCVGVFTKSITYEKDQPANSTTIGGAKAILPTEKDIAPLTPELRTLCKQMGIIY